MTIERLTKYFIRRHQHLLHFRFELADFFLFHEKLALWYLGLSEKFVFVALGISASAYLIAFRRIILQTNFGTLLLALGFLAASVVIDVSLEPWLWRFGHWKFFFEDGAKWLGIAFWCSYYVNTSYQFLVSNLGLYDNTMHSGTWIPRR